MEYNDDFFIYNIKYKNDDRAAAYLLNRYQMLSKRFANEMYAMYKQPGIIADDFYSIGLECYFRCLKRYKVGKQSFYPYWRRISHREVIHYIVNYGRLTLPNSVSFSSPANANKPDSLLLEEVIGAEDPQIISAINRKTLVNAIAENDSLGLTLEEKKVITGVSNSKTIEEIAKETNKTESHIRYVLKSAKLKLAKLKDTKK